MARALIVEKSGPTFVLGRRALRAKVAQMAPHAWRRS